MLVDFRAPIVLALFDIPILVPRDLPTYAKDDLN
jgi:hypothetical protein